MTKIEFICPICASSNLYVNMTEKVVEFRKEKFKIFERSYVCENCGNEIVDTKMGDSNLNQLYNQYREKHNALFPQEIKELRQKYKMNKLKMSMVLGWGENTYTTYENGAIPNESHNSLLKLIKDPNQFLILVNSREDILTKKEIETINLNVNELLANKNDYDWWDLIWTNDISSDTGYVRPNLEKFSNMVFFFLSYGKPYKTKLNKLLFYTDFYHYKNYSNAISGSKYRAIEFGPVPSEYDAIYNWLFETGRINISERYEDFGVTENFEATEKFNESLFNQEEIETLQIIFEKFKDFTASDIKNFSHKETAWLDNRPSKKIINFQEYAFQLNL